MERCYKNKWILLFLIIPFFKPVCFQYFTALKILEILFVVWKVIAAMIIVALLLETIYKRRKIPGLIWLVAILELSIMISTIYNRGHFQRAVIDAVSIVAFVSLFAFGMKLNFPDTITVFSRVLGILILINMLSMIFFPHGIPADLYQFNELNPLYFMNIDNGSALFLLFSMLIFSVEAYTLGDIVPRKQLILIVCCLISAFLLHSGTAIAAIGLETVLLAMIYKSIGFRSVQWKMICLLYVICAAGVIIMPQTSIVQLIMTKVFQYSADLSGRSHLWSVAIRKIGKHFLLGYGRQVQGYIPAWGRYFSSHNFWLELLLQGGLAALVIILVIIYYCFLHVENGRQSKVLQSILVTFFVMMVAVMMESAVHSVYIFGTMAVLCYYKKICIPSIENTGRIEEKIQKNVNIMTGQSVDKGEITKLMKLGKKPLVSTIVPVYNGEGYLNNLVKSIVEQQFPYMELILVDDGSSDCTLEICEKLADEYSWIKVIHTENNKGVSHARNMGLEVAEGQWIHFFDVDDRIEKGMYSEFLKTVLEASPDIIICGCDRVINGNTVICGPENTDIVDREGLRKLFDHMEMNDRYWLLDYIWNKWYRRDLIEKNKIRFFEDMNLGEDFVFNTQYFQCVKKASLVSGCFYQYLIHENGLVNRFQETPWKIREMLYHAQIELYQSLGIFRENENWLQIQAGQIAFGDIRTINSLGCKYNNKEKEEFVQKMIDSSQYVYILKYLKERGNSSLIFRIYYKIFSKRRTEFITILIYLEKRIVFLGQKMRCPAWNRRIKSV